MSDNLNSFSKSIDRALEKAHDDERATVVAYLRKRADEIESAATTFATDPNKRPHRVLRVIAQEIEGGKHRG